MKLMTLVFLLCMTQSTLASDMIVYTAQTKEDTGDDPANSEIFMMDLAKKIPVRITNNLALDYEPTLSPAGDMIAFVTDRFKYDIFGKDQIVLHSLKDGSEERIDVGIGKWCSKPTFSSDGKSLFFSMANAHTTSKPMTSYKIMVYDLERKTLKSIYAEQPGNFFDLKQSPDGKFLAYRHAYDGYQYVKIMNIDTGKSTLLNPSHPRQSESQPAWRGNDELTMLTDYGDNDGLTKSVFNVSLGNSIAVEIFKETKLMDFKSVCWFGKERAIVAGADINYDLNLFLIENGKVTPLTNSRGEVRWNIEPDCRTVPDTL